MHSEEINSLPDVLAGGVSLDWALSNNIPSKDTLPAKAFHVALYLASLIQSAYSPSPIVNAFYSIKWYHELLDLPSPTDSILVKKTC